MASIKHLQMAKAVCADERISISKSLLGLRTTATYRPTNSVMDAKVTEYSPEAGERLERILRGPRERLAEAVGAFDARPVVNGNFMLEGCLSRDGAFAALQLLRFVQMNYEPVTEVLFCEGDEARVVSRLFA